MSNITEKMCKAFAESNSIPYEYYDKYRVKRGLRNPDGTGVMAGVTNICNVHGFLYEIGKTLKSLIS